MQKRVNPEYRCLLLGDKSNSRKDTGSCIKSYYPDFYSKSTKKWPQFLNTSGIAVFVFCHKYVVKNLIFWLEPKNFLYPQDEVFY